MTRLRRTVLAALGLGLFLLVWEALPRFGLLNAALVPPPSAIPAALASEIRSGVWLAAVLSSLSHYATGLLVGSLLGVALGTASGMFRLVEDLTAWIVRLIRPIPGLAWVPFAIIWFGVEPAAAVFIIAIGVFWIVFFATQGAIRGVDRDLVEVAEAFGFRSARARLVKILLPAATPGIMVGLRTALGQAWMAVVAAEIFGVPGVGQRMMQASSLLATDIVLVYMLTMAALYGLIDSAFVAAQNWLLRWRT
ncbi:ABC transporter permease [Enterovirga sp.]|jgi:NitT/TauT family transport system permease protein|uniref:ABC transporter permease n=1 Tax=Enterovirga sp. TaxID=2026350 RepID=UPI00260A4F2A|nr:ABC transporter permease [Enterovirga sp.]MDB5590812.1 nitrate transporter permease [Enterovirga sp.]